MIRHPGVLALLCGTAIAFALLLYAAALGVWILTRWDSHSSSTTQLQLERTTYLVSSAVQYAFGFELVSGLLYLYTVEAIHPLFIGAMCATGALNANPVGWWVLLVKIVLFFAAGLWLAFNRLDQDSVDAPLLRAKYLALIALTPLVGADLCLLYRYFSGLRPDIITSCCGSLFSLGSNSVAGELTALPPAPTMYLFFLSAGLQLGVSTLCLRYAAPAWRYLLSATSGWLFAVSLASIVSFISLYVYELPTHHCPFDMMQANYAYIGYPIYISLFFGTHLGLIPATDQTLKQLTPWTGMCRRRERRTIRFSMASTSALLILVSFIVINSRLTLLYF